MMVTAASASSTALQGDGTIRDKPVPVSVAESAPAAGVTVDFSKEARLAAITQRQIATMREQGFSDALIAEWQEKGGIDIPNRASIIKWGSAPPQPGDIRIMDYQEDFHLVGLSDDFIAKSDLINCERVAREGAQEVVRQAGDDAFRASLATNMDSVAAALRNPRPDAPPALSKAFDTIARMRSALGTSSGYSGKQLLSDPTLRMQLARNGVTSEDVNRVVEQDKLNSYQARGDALGEASTLEKYGIDGPAILRGSDDQLVLNSFTLSNVAGFQVRYDAVTDNVAILRGDCDITANFVDGFFQDRSTNRTVASGSATVAERVDAKLREQSLSAPEIAAWHEKYGTLVSTKDDELRAKANQTQERNRAKLSDALAAEADPSLRETPGAAAEKAWLEQGRNNLRPRSVADQKQTADARATLGLPPIEEWARAVWTAAKAHAPTERGGNDAQPYAYSNGGVTLFTKRLDQGASLHEQLHAALKAPLKAMQTNAELMINSGLFAASPTVRNGSLTTP